MKPEIRRAMYARKKLVIRKELKKVQDDFANLPSRKKGSQTANYLLGQATAYKKVLGMRY